MQNVGQINYEQARSHLTFSNNHCPMLKQARNILSIFYKLIGKNKLSILGLPKDIKLI